MRKLIYFNKLGIGILFSFLIGSSCQKMMNEKPGKSLIVPDNLDDLQALLNNENQINITGPDLLELVADNFYTPSSLWQSANDEQRLSYIWDEKSAFLPTWQIAYQGPIYYSNVVLDLISTLEIKESERIQANEIKGSALFHRANAFQQIAQLYCRPYSKTAKSDLGIPLRLTAAVEVKSHQSTVQQTYDQIINDLKAAIDILPNKSLFPTRPTKAAALGLLARTYLCMRDYENAGKYADLFLKIHHELMDYNDIVNNDRPFKRFNIETIFYNNGRGRLTLLSANRARIDNDLYVSYNDNDLRKTLFFKENSGANVGTFQFKGNYDGEFIQSRSFIGGITTDEMYLIRSECYARTGNKELALKDLNILMKNRWRDDGAWVPFMATSSEEALEKILIERRKELVFRGLRWSDLRRLNLEGANITLKRVLGDDVYTLPPNDLRWVLLLPDEVINRSDMKQNPREGD